MTFFEHCHQEHRQNEIQHKVYLSTLLHKRKATFQGAFLLRVSVYHFACCLVNFGIPLGSHPIKSALARHTGDIGTFPGLRGLCFGFCFAGPLPQRSLSHGPLLRVHFGESLVLDYNQKSTKSTLAVKLSVSAIIYPRWTATFNMVLKLTHVPPW